MIYNEWKNNIKESDDQEDPKKHQNRELIPFIVKINIFYSHTKAINCCWFIGSFFTFQEMCSRLIPSLGVADGVEIGQNVLDFKGLSECLNKDSIIRHVTLWSKDLKLVNQARFDYIFLDNNPIYLSEVFNRYFVEPGKFLGEYENGNAEDEVYLSTSLRNDPLKLISLYPEEKINSLSDAIGWSEKTKSALLGVSKSQGLI